MSPGQLVPAFALLLLVGCSNGGGGTDITDTDPPGPAASIELTASAAAVEVGGTVQLTATAKDASGRTIPNISFTWSSDATLLATVSNTGLVSGRSPGTPVFIASLPSGISKSGTLAVKAPPRRTGSLLVLGRDSVFQHGDYSLLTTIGMADTSAIGKDSRIGIVHVELSNTSLNTSITRDGFPLLSAIAECPNGEIYAASHSGTQDPVRLYQVNPENTTLTIFIRDPGMRTVVRSMLCDSTNNLWVASEFASVGELYRVSRTSRQVSHVRSYSTVSTAASVRGMAQSPTGTIYATIRPAFSSEGQLVATISQTNGAWTSVVAGQPYRFPITENLAFRGNRLFGRSGSSFVEINPQTGEVSTIRSMSIP